MANMQWAEEYLESSDGTSLYIQRWLPENAPRANLVIVHGVGEHSGRYDNLVNYLVPRGIAVWGFDLRGHGRTDGQRGHINSWEEYRQDVRCALDWVTAQGGSAPRFLLGHSMGALIVLDYIARDAGNLSGAIISGAPIEPIGVGSPALIAAARVMSRLWPTFSLNLGLDQSALSRDQQVVEAYMRDPLVHPKTTARWGTEALDTVAWVKARPAHIKLPLLMLHGEADRINSAEGARAFCARIASTDKVFKVYPGGYHEPHNDLDHAQVAADMEQWITQRL
jgi:alpha-beta hydrolase superfamily lysophospholipase